VNFAPPEAQHSVVVGSDPFHAARSSDRMHHALRGALPTKLTGNGTQENYPLMQRLIVNFSLTQIRPQLNVYIIQSIYTLALNMRTNIVIDDSLMANALKMTGLKTKREVVELGLKTLIKLKKQENIRQFRGKLTWEGNLDAMRSDD